MNPDETMASLTNRLGKVRLGRVRPNLIPVLGGDVEQIRKDLGRRVKAAGQLMEAWYEIAPPGLRDHARPIGVSRGILRLEVDGPAFRYQLERWLKGGGKKALLQRCSTSIRRVKVETGAGLKRTQ